MKKLILFPFLVIVLFACQSNEERIIGHWHSLNDNWEDYYMTIDFLDSSKLVYNINNISRYYNKNYWISENSLEISQECSAGYSCNFNGDTLSFSKLGPRWVRVEHNT